MSSPDRAIDGVAPLPRATFDEFLADDLNENDIVFVDGVGHKFLMKIPHGPHVFCNGDASKEVRLGTAELLNMVDKKRYYRQGTSSPKFERAEQHADHDRRIKVAFNAFPEAPRSKAQVKWLYVAKYQQFLTENGTYARNVDNAREIIEAVANDNDKAAPGEKMTLPRKVTEAVGAGEFDTTIARTDALLAFGLATPDIVMNDASYLNPTSVGREGR